MLQEKYNEMHSDEKQASENNEPRDTQGARDHEPQHHSDTSKQRVHDLHANKIEINLKHEESSGMKANTEESTNTLHEQQQNVPQHGNDHTTPQQKEESAKQAAENVHKPVVGTEGAESKQVTGDESTLSREGVHHQNPNSAPNDLGLQNEKVEQLETETVQDQLGSSQATTHKIREENVGDVKENENEEESVEIPNPQMKEQNDPNQKKDESTSPQQNEEAGHGNDPDVKTHDQTAEQQQIQDIQQTKEQPVSVQPEVQMKDQPGHPQIINQPNQQHLQNQPEAQIRNGEQEVKDQPTVQHNQALTTGRAESQPNANHMQMQNDPQGQSDSEVGQNAEINEQQVRPVHNMHQNQVIQDSDKKQSQSQGHVNTQHQSQGHVDTQHQSQGHVDTQHQSQGHVGIQPQSQGHVDTQHQSHGHVGIQPQSQGHVGVQSQSQGHVDTQHQSQGHVGIPPQSQGHVDIQPQSQGHVGVQPQGQGHVGTQGSQQNVQQPQQDGTQHKINQNFPAPGNQHSVPLQQGSNNFAGNEQFPNPGFPGDPHMFGVDPQFAQMYHAQMQGHSGQQYLNNPNFPDGFGAHQYNDQRFAGHPQFHQHQQPQQFMHPHMDHLNHQFPNQHHMNSFGHAEHHPPVQQASEAVPDVQKQDSLPNSETIPSPTSEEQGSRALLLGRVCKCRSALRYS